MNLNFYDDETEKQVRQMLERLSKDLVALENLLNKTSNPAIIEKVKTRIHNINKQMEQVAYEHYSSQPNSTFYVQFLKESISTPTKLKHTIKTNLRKGQRTAEQQNILEIE